MYGRLAPKLHDNGWAALIPLVPGEKRPAVSGWEAYNINPPTDLQIERWAMTHPHHGIGLAAGPDQVLGSDLDFLDPAKAARARAINDDYLGASPMIRIGRSPKSMHFYRASPGLQLPAKNFGGFELFLRTGQTVLYAIHPDTGQPYHWPEESPESLSPSDLPIVSQVMADAFVTAMADMREDRATTRAGSTVSNTGRAAAWLRHFSTMKTPVEMIEAACDGIMGVGPGARHATMQATTLALTMRGITLDEYIEPVTAAYASTLTEKERRERRRAVVDAARWANTRAWGGKVDVAPVKLKVSW